MTPEEKQELTYLLRFNDINEAIDFVERLLQRTRLESKIEVLKIEHDGIKYGNIELEKTIEELRQELKLLTDKK